MSFEDKFFYHLINIETNAVLQGRELMTKDEAAKRNRALQMAGSKKHMWIRCDIDITETGGWQPSNLFER